MSIKDRPLVDDIGSFPLPDYANKELFEQLYWDAYNAILKDIDISRNRSIQKYVIQPIVDSFKKKIDAGLDIVNYPQAIEMNHQFLKPIEEYEEEPFLINENKAQILELKIIEKFAKEFYEKTATPLKLRACVTGPMELYNNKMGFSVYKDIAINLAKSVNRFLKNSIINEKYVKTEVLSIDEPSLGLVTFNQVSNDDISDILKIATQNIDCDIQIHLHSLNAYMLVLNVDSINILTCEYAADTKNIIPKKDLEDYDKFIRVGIARTNLGTIISEFIEKGEDSRKFNTKEGLSLAIDPIERIQKRLKEAINHYGSRLKYVGPDCGLKSWEYEDVAFKLLKNTVDAVNLYFR
ncbi:MAG: hypothetical protein ACTSRZ_08110 [Promethearchaeota archaeon]